MYHTNRPLILSIVLFGSSLFAQGLPTTQPALLQIYVEEIKPGHSAEYVKNGVEWRTAFENASSTDYYLALVSMTGPREAWFIIPYESHAAMGKSMESYMANPELTAAMERLERDAAEHSANPRSIQAVARKNVSHGTFPDIAKQRFWDITTFRVRPGHEEMFVKAANAYGSAAKRSAPETSYRVYEVIAGMPSPTYLIFSSTGSFAEFDAMLSRGEATMKGATPEEQAALQQFSREAAISMETQRFRLDPMMSFVPKEVREQDPAFWSPKKTSESTPRQ